MVSIAYTQNSESAVSYLASGTAGQRDSGTAGQRDSGTAGQHNTITLRLRVEGFFLLGHTDGPNVEAALCVPLIRYPEQREASVAQPQCAEQRL